MPKKAYRVEGLEADPEHVTKGTTHMYKQFQKFMEENKYSVIDAFMIAHSFHKMVVLSVMARWRLDGFEPEKTLHLADMTWRHGLEAVRKNLKAPPPVTTAQQKADERIAQDYRQVVSGSPKAKAHP
jgi:hypothetical protein